MAAEDLADRKRPVDRKTGQEPGRHAAEALADRKRPVDRKTGQEPGRRAAEDLADRRRSAPPGSRKSSDLWDGVVSRALSVAASRCCSGRWDLSKESERNLSGRLLKLQGQVGPELTK